MKLHAEQIICIVVNHLFKETCVLDYVFDKWLDTLYYCIYFVGYLLSYVHHPDLFRNKTLY